jgi:hypothetical protein
LTERQAWKKLCAEYGVRTGRQKVKFRKWLRRKTRLDGQPATFRGRP